MLKSSFPIILLIIIFSLHPLLAGQNTATITYTSRIDQLITDEVTWEVMERGSDRFRPLSCSPTEISLLPRKTVTVSCTSDDFPSSDSGPHTLRITLRGESTITTYGKAKNCEDIGGRCKLFGCLSTETEASDASCGIGQTCCVLNPTKKCDKNPALCTGSNVCYLTDPDLKTITAENMIKKLETESSGTILPQNYKEIALQGCIPQTLFEKFIKKNCKVLSCMDMDLDYPKEDLQVPSSCTTFCKDTTQTSFMPRDIDDSCKDSQTIIEARCKGEVCVASEQKCPNGQECKTDPFTRKGYCSCTSSSGYLKITKFSDNNGNGIQDSGETGVPGIRFSVKSKTAETSMVTDENGQAKNVCLTPTIYEVTEMDAPGDWVLTTPKTVTLEVTGKESFVEAKFGNKPLGTITIVTFQDNDGDGEKDMTEPNLPGFSVSVKKPDGKTIQLKTDKNGEASLPKMPMGKYEATIDQNSGMELTTEKTQEAALTPNERSETFYFGSAKPEPPAKETCGFLKLIKFEDLNKNGDPDTGESLLSGFTFQVSSGSTILTMPQTNDMGESSTLCIPSGTYTITETNIPEGWAPIVRQKTVTISESDTETNPKTVKFGNWRTDAGIHITAFNDIDRDGKWDSDEKKFDTNKALEATLWWGTFGSNDPGIHDTVASLASGEKLVYPVKIGYYSIGLRHAGYYTCTTCTGLDKVLTEAGKTTEVLIGLSRIKAGMLNIQKYNDLNGNGIMDENEPGVKGFTFLVKMKGSQYGEVFTTDDNGMIEVMKDIGEYSVEEIVMPEGKDTNIVYIPMFSGSKKVEVIDGWKNTTPIKIENVMVEDAKDTDISFGNRKIGELTIMKTDEEGNPLKDFVFDVSGPDKLTGLTTGADGKIAVSGLSIGTYTITERDKAGWVHISEKTQVTTLSRKSPSATLAFKNKLKPEGCGYVRITKFNDKDGNGVYDTGEELMGGFTFNYYEDTGFTHKSDVLEEEDVYSILSNKDGVAFDMGKCFPSGKYIVAEVPQSGWDPSPNKEEGSKQKVVLDSDKNYVLLEDIDIENNQVIELKFGSRRPSGDGGGGFPIEEQKKCDGILIQKSAMINGAAQTTGLDKFTFEVTTPDGKTSTKNTDAVGKIMVCEGAGTYKVTEIVPDGWTATPSGTQKVEVPSQPESSGDSEEKPEPIMIPVSFVNTKSASVCADSCKNEGFARGSCSKECSKVGDKVDIAFLVDTSGSMNAENSALCSAIEDSMKKIRADGIDVQYKIYALGCQGLSSGVGFGCSSQLLQNSVYNNKAYDSCPDIVSGGAKEPSGSFGNPCSFACGEGSCISLNPFKTSVCGQGERCISQLSLDSLGCFCKKDSYCSAKVPADKEKDAGAQGQFESWGPGITWAALGSASPGSESSGAFKNAWRDGAKRIIVPVTDECPFEGDDCDWQDSEAINEAITTAKRNAVLVYPLAGQATGKEASDYMKQIADSSGGSVLSFPKGDGAAEKLVIALTSMVGEYNLGALDCSGETPVCCCGLEAEAKKAADPITAKTTCGPEFKCGCSKEKFEWCKTESDLPGCEQGVKCCQNCVKAQLQEDSKMDLSGVVSVPDYITLKYHALDIPMDSEVTYSYDDKIISPVGSPERKITSYNQILESKYSCLAEGETIISLNIRTSFTVFEGTKTVNCAKPDKPCSERVSCSDCVRYGCTWCASSSSGTPLCLDSSIASSCPGGKGQKTCDVTCPEKCCSGGSGSLIYYNPKPVYTLEVKPSLVCAPPYEECGLDSSLGSRRECALGCDPKKTECYYSEDPEIKMCVKEGESCNLDECCPGLICEGGLMTKVCKKQECIETLRDSYCQISTNDGVRVIPPLIPGVSGGKKCNTEGETLCSGLDLYKCSGGIWSVYMQCGTKFHAGCEGNKCILDQCTNSMPLKFIGKYCPGSSIYNHVEACIYRWTEKYDRFNCLVEYVFSNQGKYSTDPTCQCSLLTDKLWSPEKQVNCYDSGENLCKGGCGSCTHVSTTLYSLLVTCGEACGVNEDKLYIISGMVLPSAKTSFGPHSWVMYDHPQYGYVFVDFPWLNRKLDYGVFSYPEDYYCTHIISIRNLKGEISDTALLKTLSERCKYYDSSDSGLYYDVNCYK